MESRDPKLLALKSAMMKTMMMEMAALNSAKLKDSILVLSLAQSPNAPSPAEITGMSLSLENSVIPIKVDAPPLAGLSLKTIGAVSMSLVRNLIAIGVAMERSEHRL